MSREVKAYTPVITLITVSGAKSLIYSVIANLDLWSEGEELCVVRAEKNTRLPFLDMLLRFMQDWLKTKIIVINLGKIPFIMIKIPFSQRKTTIQLKVIFLHIT